MLVGPVCIVALVWMARAIYVSALESAKGFS